MLVDSSTFILLACLFGFLMAFGIGANDVANAMGTSVGAKALTVRNAIIIAAIFEFTGAFLAGGEVTETISKGIIDVQDFEGMPQYLVYGMLASLLAAGTWLLIATLFGWPVSTTHSIVGAIVGVALVVLGAHAVQWIQVFFIVLSWIISPLMGGGLAFLLFLSVQKFIFNADNPLKNAKRYIPIYILLATFVITMYTLLKGFKHLGFNLSSFESTLISVVISFLASFIGHLALKRIPDPEEIKKSFHFRYVEKAFAVLMIFTACAMAFAHGSNDVANSIGPIAAVISVVGSQGELLKHVSTPTWLLFLGAAGIVVGLVVLGKNVIATVGTAITELTPSRGFAAELAAATTVVMASGIGLPVSTTHTLVGAVLGVGLARGIGAINLRVVRSIFTSWMVTLPAGAFLAIIFFYVLKFTFE